MNDSPKTNKSAFLVLVTYLAFISLGLPDGLLGIAWPFMSARSGVPLDALGILLIGFTTGYLLTSSTSGKILKVINLGVLLSLSCVLTGLSLATYAFVSQWQVMIVAAFFLGAGGGAIDSSINTFAAARFSASTVNWLHAFYGVGATAGPLLVTLMLAQHYEWYHGYAIVAGIQISLAILFLITQRLWQVSEGVDDHHSSAEYLHTLGLPVVWLNMAIFFLYTGLEQGFGQWLFTVLTKSRNVAEADAGLWAGAYWGSLTVGRILFGIALKSIPVQKVLRGAFIGVVVGACLFAANLHSFTSALGVLILGFSNAPIFPSLISITPDQLGKEHTATAVGIQISMAMLGGALLPGLAGLLSNQFGLEVISIVFAIASIVLALLFGLTKRR